MALKSTALTTVQRAADFIGLGTITASSTKETVLIALINTVTSSIENYLGYKVKKATYTQEEYTIEKGKYLTLKNFPVVNGEVFRLYRRTTALNQGTWEEVDSDNYFVNEPEGIIEATIGGLFARSRKGYSVTYTAGYDFDNSTTYLGDTDGADIELACWMLVSGLYSRRKGGAGIKSERIGDYSVSYSASLMQNEDVTNILDNFRRIEPIGDLTPLHY